jgi:hypothetical protein
MRPVIESYIEKNYLKPFDIDKEEVENAVKNFTYHKTINFQGYTIVLIVKKYPKYLMLIDGRWQSSDRSLLVTSVFILGEELVIGIDVSNPLAVLERFCQEFGYTISVGDQQSRFIHYGQIDMVDSSKANTVDIIRNYVKITDNGMNVEDYLGDIRMRPVNLGGYYLIEIALAYCINNDKYSIYLSKLPGKGSC